MRAVLRASALIVFGLLAAVAACAGSSAGPGDVPYGKRFDVPIGQTVTVGEDGVAVTFESVKSDSRCPMDAVCIQAGDAVAVFRFEAGGRSLTRELHTSRRAPDVTIDNYSVRLLALLPYPRTDRKTEPAEYVAQVQVDKK